MSYFFCIILTFLLFSCSPPKETIQQESVVDLDSLNSVQSDVDMSLFEDPSQKKNSESPSPPEPPKKETAVALDAQTLPVSQPHSGSPGGNIADTLKIFQCEKLNAKGQDNFFLHILNYRIHQLGVHPLCEVIQVKNLPEEAVKEVLAYAYYQRSYCDTYTSEFIDKLEPYQCVQIITLAPFSNKPPV